MMATVVQNFRLTAALAYAATGWHVFPIQWPKVSPVGAATCSCGALDCGNVGKHPLTPNGLKDASIDEQVIRNWWARWPAANIGVCTGEKSGIVVLDVDPRHGGKESLAALMDEHGDLPETVEARTGSGGSHIVFSHPGVVVRNSSSKLGPGLDIRGDGGYIVAAPSLHSCGQRYAWQSGVSPSEYTPVAMPDWMLAKLRPSPVVEPHERISTGDNAVYWLAKALAKCQVGNRNDTGFWLAQQLRDAGLSEGEAAGVMRDYAERVPRGDRSYTDREALQSLRSAYQSPPRQPAKSLRFSEKVIRVSTKVETHPFGAAEELRIHIKDVVEGRYFNVPLAFPMLTNLSQCGLPGTITCVCGDPGVGKTLWVLQNLQHWHGNGHDSAVWFIEKDRMFHTRRLLAQLEHSWDYINLEWVRSHPVQFNAAIERNAPMLDDLGKCIFTGMNERVTLDKLLAWILQMASAGKRMIVIDPITAAAAGAERWQKDDEFVIAAQKILTAHGSSLILITHSKKGNRPGNPTGHDMAAGAAYYRFADCAIWLVKTKKPRKVIYQSQHGTGKSRFSLFAQLHKTRDGPGSGQDIAFLLTEGGWYTEQGIVIGDDKSEDEEEQAA